MATLFFIKGQTLYLREQKTVTNTGEETTLAARGRHDPCVLPRAELMVDAMVHPVIVDPFLRQRAQNR